MATVAKSNRSTKITLTSAIAGPFDLDFRLFDTDAVVVYVNNIRRTDWFLTTSFNDGYDDNATVTFTGATSIGDVVVIDSALFPHRAEDYGISTASLAQKLDIELGRVWSSLSDQNRDNARSLRLLDSTSPLVPYPGRVLGYDQDGNLGPIEWETSVEPDDFPSYSTVAAMIADTSLVTGTTIKTLGNENAGDGGDGKYRIMTAADYLALTDTPDTPDGYVDHTLSNGLVARLLHGGQIRAEQASVVLSVLGLAQEKSAAFNAAFSYACSIQPDTFDDGVTNTTGVNWFSCHTDFMAKDVLNLRNGGSTANSMTIFLSGHVKAITGGEFDVHTQERPIPLVHARLRNCTVFWPRLECRNIAAGIKMKKDVGCNHYALDMRGFSRYGLWKVAGNDSVWHNVIIKQFLHGSTDIINGVDPANWANWHADAIVITTKDHQFIGGQIGWGGPCYRITDSMPDDADERIPGQNCYWCGLEDGQGYLDGDNGGGDMTGLNAHMMQGIQVDSALDAAMGPRTGAYADYDLATGNLIVREVDTPLGVLSFCKVSNLSYFDRVDNDMCNHYLFGAQIEFTDELTGSAPNVNATSTDANLLLDPRIRVFASRGNAGGQRFPFMTSMRGQRQMTIAFCDNPAEIYHNGAALVEASTSWNGDFDEWNRLNRASGSYSGQMQWQSTLAAGTYTPTVTAAGDYWLALGAVTMDPGGVVAADGQFIIALTASPAGSGDWLVVDADSAPVRETNRFETSVLPHQYFMYPEANVSGFSQVNLFTGDVRFSEAWYTAGGYKVVQSFEADVWSLSGATSYSIDNKFQIDFTGSGDRVAFIVDGLQVGSIKYNVGNASFGIGAYDALGAAVLASGLSYSITNDAWYIGYAYAAEKKLITNAILTAISDDIATLADATTGSAAEINALRDKIVAAINTAAV